MKKYLLPISVCTIMFLGVNSAFAWHNSNSLTYANPQTYTLSEPCEPAFSLNPFTGFKNCCKCKEKKVKCDACTGAAAPVCTTCTKAFPKKSECNSCQKIIMPVYEVIEEPMCPCGRKY